VGCQAEIADSQFQGTLFFEHDIFWFEITVDDSFAGELFKA
jgi:hypothetical protein